MRRTGRVRLSFTNVLVTVALFATLGGTSYAALRVSGKNIKDNTVGSTDVKNYTLMKKDFGKGLFESSAAAPLSSIGYEAERDSGPVDVAPGDYTTVATLNLPPGPYIVFGKADLSSTQLDSGRCQLQAGGKVDTSARGLRSNGTPEALNLQQAATLAGPGTITLSCKTTDGNWTATDSKILAVKVDFEQG